MADTMNCIGHETVSELRAPRPVRLHPKVAERLVVTACLDADMSVAGIEDSVALREASARLADRLGFVEELESGEVGGWDDIQEVGLMLRSELAELQAQLGQTVIWDRRSDIPDPPRKSEIRSLAKLGGQIEQGQREVRRFDLERQELAGELTALGRQDLDDYRRHEVREGKREARDAAREILPGAGVPERGENWVASSRSLYIRGLDESNKPLVEALEGVTFSPDVLDLLARAAVTTEADGSDDVRACLASGDED